MDGNIEGRGRFVWTNGKKYEGEWKMGKMHGKGSLLMPDGSFYKG